MKTTYVKGFLMSLFFFDFPDVFALKPAIFHQLNLLLMLCN